MTAATGSVLLRSVRPVPVGGGPVPGTVVDLRIAGGVVTGVRPGLRPERGEDVLDAGGRWLVPGLWDAHVHLGQWARTRSRLDVSGTASPEEVAAIVAAHVADRPAGELVVGYGWRSAGWPRQPATADLDAVAPRHPVVLVSGDAHGGWLSSAAPRRFGLPAVAGPLLEDDWFPVLAALDAEADDDADHRAALADAAARGVVGVTDMEYAAAHREWPGRAARGVTGLRVRTAVYPDGLEDVLAAGLRTGDVLPGGHPWLTMGPLKVIADGSLNTRTACCRDPYAAADPPRGRLNVAAPELAALLDRAHRNGIGAAVHAIGDAALAEVLDAFTAVGARGSLEHVQLADPADLARAAGLGLRASVQPAHVLDDRDVADALWPDRTGRCFAFRAMADAGLPLALGSDAPVAPLDPWLAMAAAVHRTGDDRPPWHPEQSLTAAEALAASTDGRGAPAEGAPGDVVLLDADPLAPGTPEEVAAALRAMPVAATFVAGVPTHLAL